MSFIQLHTPLSPKLLDNVLANGFYRMRQSVFTTDAIRIEDGTVYEVFWVRVAIQDYMPTRLHRELSRRNARFSCTLHTAAINDEIENLYAAYVAAVAFDAPPTAASFLLEETSLVNFFPSRMWQVRDNGRLIANGYFDEGAESCAGILNFYHPDYRKYSLGKWMYLEGIRHAATTGRQYFYPGYIALGYPKFDYKLLPGKDRIALWDFSRRQWIPFEQSDYALYTVFR